MKYVPVAAQMAATTGDATAGRMILPMTPSSLVPSPAQLTPFQPSEAMVAPIRPPNSACEELDGRLSSQVSRFQTMPPIRPANTIASKWSWFTRWAGTAALVAVAGLAAASVLTTALVTVTATETDRKAPTRFATAEMATATFGFSAPVAIDVAIALPVSWKPLVKSKPSAVTTTRARIKSLRSRRHPDPRSTGKSA